MDALAFCDSCVLGMVVFKFYYKTAPALPMTSRLKETLYGEIHDTGVWSDISAYLK